SSNVESIGGLGGSDVEPLRARTTRAAWCAYVLTTGGEKTSANAKLLRLTTNSTTARPDTATSARRCATSPTASAIWLKLPRRTGRMIASTSATVVSDTTISQTGATRVTIAATSGMNRRSQYRLISRP